MNTLPKELEDIIVDYQQYLEQTDKMKKVFEELHISIMKRQVKYKYHHSIDLNQDPHIIGFGKEYNVLTCKSIFHSVTIFEDCVRYDIWGN
jgi:hypothetical protein